ncbi:Hypothetical protein MYA_0855 [Burkholderia sp. KJ006]|nr:Hypothetical protein MYA_0855 [Burkholderia sp. KJ006]
MQHRNVLGRLRRHGASHQTRGAERAHDRANFHYLSPPD